MNSSNDASNGYEAIAVEFQHNRSAVGKQTVRQWAAALPEGGTVLDVGAGSGYPVTCALAEAGLKVWAIDASPTLLHALSARLPEVQTACEPIETSDFFGCSFDGIVAIGLMFLLSAKVQGRLITRLANRLNPGGRFLFSAPREVGHWDDVLTGRRSQSLGERAYRGHLERAGLVVDETRTDDGGNFYYQAHQANH